LRSLPQFDYAADFSEGLAAVQQDGRYGYIDTAGNWVVEPTYTNAGRFSEGFARVQMENQWGFIDEKGNLMTGNVF
jgi:hypothetical protein